MKNKILDRVEYLNFDKEEYSILEFINRFEDYLGVDNVSIILDYPGYDGGYMIGVKYFRLETDEEYNKRVEQENLLREKELRKTKQEYQKLKNKLYCLEQQFPEIKNV